ncbi:MAG: DUF4352 domain-containing protein [Clostridium sp.]|jgi:hypothetical protein|nr:DUF4352 domain-containing protein [Clostridium sp.]
MKIVRVTILLSLCIFLSGCGTTTPEKVEIPNAGQESTETTPEHQTKVFDIGETIKSNDIYFTVNGVREVPGGQFMSPDDGNIWYAVDVTIENKGKESFNSSSLLMFSLIDSEAYSYNVTFGPDLNGSVDGEIAPGRKLRGEVAFEIPKGSTGLELEIKPFIWGNGLIIVKLDR